MTARSLYQINTRVWLAELSRELRRQATLADIRDATLDRWSELGFDFIWMLGVWKTGAAGQRVSASRSDWCRDYEETLGRDLHDEDISGSPFAVQGYTAHPDFGGNDALALLRHRLNERGMRLILDFVPNHTAIDHPWVNEHPEFYVHGTEEDLAREPHAYIRVETERGSRIIAYGRDPYSGGWPDTLQLNYANRGLHDAMRQELLQVAGMCDGVRCDMAMLLLPRVFQSTWGARAKPIDGSAFTNEAFWPEAIALVRRQEQDFVFIAEAYWDTEWEMQQQGFDYAYDKRLYDRLLAGNVEQIRDHLGGASVEFQRKLVRFLENHDERRAASTFPFEVHRAAAILTFLTPGLRLFHEGQLEGRKIKVNIHLKRRPPEPVDNALHEFYSRLLSCICRPALRNAEWRFLELAAGADGDTTWKQFIAFSWEVSGELKILAAVNYTGERGKCSVKLPFPALRGRRFRVQDLFTSEKYERNGDELVQRGLYLELPPWGYSVVEVVESTAEL